MSKFFLLLFYKINQETSIIFLYYFIALCIFIYIYACIISLVNMHVYMCVCVMHYMRMIPYYLIISYSLWEIVSKGKFYLSQIGSSSLFFQKIQPLITLKACTPWPKCSPCLQIPKILHLPMSSRLGPDFKVTF